GGFLCFIPLAVQPRKKSASIKRRTSAMDDLKTIAISRLMLDNFPHIKSYWINIGTQLTQLSMHFGASDIHGTLVEERISHSAGALTQTALTRDELVWLIKGANRIPVERDTFYNEIRAYREAPPKTKKPGIARKGAPGSPAFRAHLQRSGNVQFSGPPSFPRQTEPGIFISGLLFRKDPLSAPLENQRENHPQEREEEKGQGNGFFQEDHEVAVGGGQGPPHVVF